MVRGAAKAFLLVGENNRIQRCEQMQCAGRDPRRDETTVFLSPNARHKACLLHSVEQARDIGHTCEHPVTQLVPRQSMWLRTAKDPQHVVLCRSDAVWSK